MQDTVNLLSPRWMEIGENEIDRESGDLLDRLCDELTSRSQTYFRELGLPYHPFTFDCTTGMLEATGYNVCCRFLIRRDPRNSLMVACATSRKRDPMEIYRSVT